MIDEMTSEEAREQLKDIARSFPETYFGKWRKALDFAIKALDPRWIPVSERLPKQCEYGEVLVTYIPSGGTLWATVIIAHYSDLMGIAKPSFHIGEVGKESFQNITKHVIAWMPLPKPYKEDEE